MIGKGKRYFPLRPLAGNGNGVRRAVVLGHSWPRRIFSGVNSYDSQITDLGLWPAIHSGAIPIGEVYANLMNLDLQYDQVVFRHVPFLREYANNDDITTELHAIRALAPTTVICHLGTNDIVRIPNDPEQIALDYINLAITIRDMGVKHVVLMSCQDRMAGAPSTYYYRMQIFNQVLASSCPYMEAISYYRVRGFSKHEDGSQLEVYEWSQDGIHPDPSSHYFNKYRLELRAALLSAIPYMGYDLNMVPEYEDQYRRNNPPPPPPPTVQW